MASLIIVYFHGDVCTFFVSEPSIIAASPGMDVIWRGEKAVQVLERGYNVVQPHFFLIIATQQTQI
jgi:hypothetical protein